MSKYCEVPECVRRVPWDRVMCLPHWRMVSKPTGDKVWATWRARQANNHRANIVAHDLAKDAAIAEVVAKLRKIAAKGVPS